jgi:hypothetical protein
MEACKGVLVKKREEYVNDPNIDVNIDVLSNFKNNAELSIVGTPEGITWELMTKHLQSIKDYCAGRKVSSGVLNEKIGDAINYLVLIKAIISERECFGTDAVNDAVNEPVNELWFPKETYQVNLSGEADKNIGEGLMEVFKPLTLEQMEEIGKNNIGKMIMYLGESDYIYTQGSWYEIVLTSIGNRHYVFGISDNSGSYCTTTSNSREDFLRLFDFHNIRPKND